jgi:hypothetical protein
LRCFLQCVYVFASNINQEHILANESKVAVRSKMADQKQIFRHNSEGIHFFNLLFAFSVVKMQNLKEKVFQKFQYGSWNEKISLSRHLGFFGILFFHKIFVLPIPNKCKKKIEKILDTERVLSRKLILIRHLGSN